jgi:hypothetical protein
MTMWQIFRAAARNSTSMFLAAACLVVATQAAHAVILDGNNRVTVTLSDGTNVVLYGNYVSKIGRRGVEDEGPRLAPLSSCRHCLKPPADDLRVATREVGGEQEKPLTPFEQAKANRDEDAKRAKDLRDSVAPGLTGYVKGHEYYYLPPANGLRLSTRPNGVPEFLFVKYTTEEREDAGGTQGGLFHFLMEWGLNADQLAELEQKLKAVDAEAVLMGAAEVDEAEEKGSFRIISAVMSDEGMARSMVQSGHAPTMPGGKVAAASNLSSQGAQLFLATVEKGRSIADLSIELDFSYAVMMPGAKGEIIFHWDKFREYSETIDAQFKKDSAGHDVTESDTSAVAGGIFPLGFGGAVASRVKTEQRYNYTDTEVAGLFDTLVENKIVELKLEGYQADDEYFQVILSGMLDYFKNSLTEPASDAGLVPPGSQEAEPGLERRPEDGRQYNFKKDKIVSSFAKKQEVTRLDFAFVVKRNFQVVGNLASWYDSVKDNPSCVLSVNLNDPFFQHREIRFILDLEAKEIFEDMVNYVTVNVKKPRSDANDFNDSITIDADYLKNKGIAASLTYARMDDKNSEAYKYQTQWSLRGGNLFPAKPAWLPGRWEGVTLAPPVESWFVEVEGDIAQMEANDIARVTVELHYPLFGQEQFKVIPLSPRGESLLGERIFVDRGTRGFAYRLIVHHKSEGRMALPWQTRIGDRYVYATLPPEILAAGKPREQAKLAAKKLGKLGADKVLDEFQELFAGAD